MALSYVWNNANWLCGEIHHLLLVLATSTESWAKLPLTELSDVIISAINTRLSQQDISITIQQHCQKGTWKPLWSCSVRAFLPFNILAYFSVSQWVWEHYLRIPGPVATIWTGGRAAWVSWVCTERAGSSPLSRGTALETSPLPLKSCWIIHSAPVSAH